MSVGEWPIAFFDDDYLKIYRTHFTEQQTGAEVDFIWWRGTRVVAIEVKRVWISL